MNLQLYFDGGSFRAGRLWLTMVGWLLAAVCSAGSLATPPGQLKKAPGPPARRAPAVGTAAPAAAYNFFPSGLQGVTLESPTSLQFGPDGRLYVAQQNGVIKAFTVVRSAANNYSATATEIINLVSLIPNHDDNGALNTAITTRQVTGILLRGTAASPILYVSSSDSRIGGPSGKTDQDTNSGIISQLTRSGGVWTKIDLVRGLPRSEENHSTNGLQIDDQTGIMYVAQAGNTNAGSPSINFNYACDYALSAAILSINLPAINAMPTKGSGNTAYKYDLPTLDDPDRPNNADGSDPFDPFGGNVGLNQAKLVPGGPVQIFSPGYRNPYDLVITKARKLYTSANGANQGWGGYPPNEGTGAVTNNYVVGEPGSTSPTPTEGTVNDLDNFHYIGQLGVYQAGSYYGGHPNPTRANPAGAGLYTSNSSGAVWRTSKTGALPLPADWPPVATAHPIEGDFQMPGTEGTALLTFDASTNGLAEYTASNFGNALKGALLACSFNGNINIITLTADGTNVTNAHDPLTKLNQDPAFASGFGSVPLDVTTQGDNDVFPGTVWVATYGSASITVFEPQDFLTCTGLRNANDDDQDGYTNADEMDNGTNPCSAASRPPDFDKDLVSDLNDPDDDNDGLADTVDLFSLDAANGLATVLPIKYDLFNNFPGTGLFGVGFTGLMCNRTSNYAALYSESNLIAGGAVGAFSVVDVPAGDALGALNTQQNGFQFGVKAAPAPFTVQGRLLGPFFNNQAPKNFQSQGIYLGTGDQDNYLKIALNANGGAGGIEVVYENAGVPTSTQFAVPGAAAGSKLDLFLAVNPATGAVQPKYAVDGGATVSLGTPVQLTGALLGALQDGNAYAVGVVATSRGTTSFTATWDFIYVTADPVTNTGAWQLAAPAAGAFTGREANAFVAAGDKFYLLGGRGIAPVQEYGLASKAWANRAAPPVELNHFQAVALDGLVYAVGALNGTYPHEVPLSSAYVFNPVANTWAVGSTIPAARRRGAGGTAVYNNKIYLAGGITDGHWAGSVAWFDEYDPTTNTWKALPDAPHLRDHFDAAVVGDKLYLAGGRRSSGATGHYFDLTVPEVDVYDFVAGTWATLPSASNLPTPRADAATAMLGNELILIGGESGQAASHKETHALNATTNAWRRLADLQEGRHGTQAIVNNNGVYIAAGASSQGDVSAPVVATQETFYLFSPTVPTGPALVQGPLAAGTALDYGLKGTNSETVKLLTLANTGSNQAILVSSIAISGSSAFTYTAPYALPFVIPVGKSVSLAVSFKPTARDAQTGSLVVAHSGQGGSATVALTGVGGYETPVYRVNAGGGQLTNSIGTFAADNSFAPAPGAVYASAVPIAGTTDDALYQSGRAGNPFSYALAVASGQQYKVVLHFAELQATAVGQRVFDVALEGTKVLKNYDIYQKVGALTATTETFTVLVADDALNLNFSALASDGGVDNARVAALEVYSLAATSPAPVANAGPNQAITLPTSTATLAGSGTALSGNTITGYAWSQVSGPNTAVFSSKAVAGPALSGLVAGSYVFALVVTDSKPTTSAASQVTVTVYPSAATGTVVYRLNAGGGALSTPLGAFAADQYFTAASSYAYSTNVAITGTTAPAIYQTERLSTANQGVFSYSMPVANGQYRVVLHFAEIYWTSTGQRVFDVTLQGVKVLNDYDIFRKVGTYVATTETFSTTVANGVLQLDFSALPGDGGVDRPKISAIEVLSLSTASSVATAAAKGSTLAPAPAGAKPRALGPAWAAPVPTADGRVQVHLAQPTQGALEYTLVSVIGAVVAKGQRLMDQPAEVLDFDFSAHMVAPGVYYLLLQTPGGATRLKLLRQ